jgi:hypothetical protein
VQFLRSEPSLKKYMERFRELEVNGDVLLKSNVQFLHKLGVESALDASKIIVLFRKSTGDGYDHERSQQDLTSAIEAASDVKWKSEYLRVINNYDLSFCILKEGGIALLKELGMTQQKSRHLIRALF